MKNIATLFTVLLLSTVVFAQVSVKTIESLSTFNLLAGRPLTEKYGQVSAVKVVFDLSDQNLYYINSDVYKYHYEFCFNELRCGDDLDYFNKVNYSADNDRRFLLGTVNYFRAQDKYVLEISPSDLMSETDILFLYRKVTASLLVSKPINFLLNSARLLQQKLIFDARINTVSPDELYKNQVYQAIGRHSGYGVLRLIAADADLETVHPTDIIVMKKTPLTYPNVAGIIVAEFQTPLSHLTILSQNRKIPIMAYKRAFQDSSILRFNHQKIHFTVTDDSFYIRAVKSFPVQRNKIKNIKLPCNLSVDSLVELKNLKSGSVAFAGNKAANLAVLFKLSKNSDFKVPENAFVIPFYFYHQHILRSNADNLIKRLIAEKDSFHNENFIRKKLSEIRSAINSFPVDSVLMRQVKRKVLSQPGFTRMRFRSSTNAEDAEGFSGAGLYTSETGFLDSHSKKSFEKAIKKVWASLWSYNAFMEREYYHINHLKAYMGVLVHRAFPNEKVNGVVITKNIYRPDSYGFVVNAQLGSNEVVKPTGGTVCDQIICYPPTGESLYKDKRTIDVITASDLNGGKLVMTEEEIQHLADQIEIIKKKFCNFPAGTLEYLNTGFDVEFKLVGEKRELYIKQIRIYND